MHMYIHTYTYVHGDGAGPISRERIIKHIATWFIDVFPHGVTATIQGHHISRKPHYIALDIISLRPPFCFLSYSWQWWRAWLQMHEEVAILHVKGRCVMAALG